MSLKDYSTKALEIELEKREKELNTPPAQLENPDFTELKKLLARLNQEMIDGEEDDDAKQWIYEEAISAVYGPSYWVWLKERSR